MIMLHESYSSSKYSSSKYSSPKYSPPKYGWTEEQSNRCFHQLFEQQARLRPDKTAIRCDGKSLIYAELNRAANRVADRLKAAGVGPEILVGLYTQRSLVMIVGLIGILKAGGAYLPLDSQYPAQRLEFMLAETEAPVVLCEQALRDRLPKLPEASQVIALAVESGGQLSIDAADAFARAENISVNQTLGPDNLAYIIYTSGSTGKPKGVMVTQQNLADYCWAVAQPTALTEKDTYLHLGSISFATSSRQLVMPLAHGATVVITTDEERQSPLTALQLAKAERVTIMDMVPSYWRVLNAMLKQLDAEDRQHLLTNDLRFVNGHGEPLPRYIPQTWREFGHTASILNLYGQAEATGVVTVRPYQEDDPSPVVPVGNKIPGAQIYVLDENLQLAGPNVYGEIYTAGFGITRGYFKRPEQTAERFLWGDRVPKALRSSLTERPAAVYKTGDMGRIRPDGVFEMLGRVDRQVKINGIRLEMDEVEAAIAQHPWVRGAAVAAAKTGASELSLSAYLALEENGLDIGAVSLKTHPKIINQLKTDLAQQLASYMMPSQFFVLEQLPLTPNGKIDRKALLVSEVAPIRTVEFVAPRSEIEQALAVIWSETLQTSPIGAEDDFFDLGGHSLLATQMAARIESEFSHPVSLAGFFQSPTIASQAKLLQADAGKEGSAERSCLVPMQSAAGIQPDKPAIFCVHGGGGSALMFRSLARRMSDRVAIYGLQSSFLNDPTKLLNTIEEMADLYLQELRSVQPTGPYLIAGYCGGAPVALEIAQRLRAESQTVALLILFDPTSIQTDRTPPIARYERTAGTKLQSLNTRIQRQGVRAVAITYWRKARIKLYEKRSRLYDSKTTLPLDLRVVKVAETNARAVYRYVATSLYPDPIAVYMPEQSITPGGGLAQGWEAIATGEFKVHRVVGNHHFDGATAGSFFREPAVQTLAARLAESIDEVLPG